MKTAVFFIAGTVSAFASGPLDRVQSIDLKAGWNAVYLEVEPIDSDPAAVFGGAPINIVATYFGGKPGAQFSTDPSIDLFQNLGWAVWYDSARPDAFLTTLDAIYGRRAYLVHATADFAWSVTGTAMPDRRQWRADRFNLVGFPLADPGAPSFAQFFAAAKGPQPDKIYRLVDGSWQKLTNPAATPMRAGEAFWIYCDAPSSYAGPLVVETALRRGLVLADGGSDRLVLRNRGADPLEVTVEHVAPTALSVPLSLRVKVLGAPNSLVSTLSVQRPAGAWSETLTLAPGVSLALPFEARLAEMGAPLQSSLLKVSTALGTESWIPVFATRSDLSDNE